MALKPQTYYEETGAGVDAVVPLDSETIFEKCEVGWRGPIDADMDGLDDAVESGLLVEKGELTDRQFAAVKKRATVE